MRTETQLKMLKIGELLLVLVKHEDQRHCMQAVYFVRTMMSGASFGGSGTSMNGDKKMHIEF
jgi:hypothetical protein